MFIHLMVYVHGQDIGYMCTTGQKLLYKRTPGMTIVRWEAAIEYTQGYSPVAPMEHLTHFPTVFASDIPLISSIVCIVLFWPLNQCIKHWFRPGSNLYNM